MIEGSRLTPELARAFTAAGWWRGRPLCSYLDEAAAERPGHVALVGRRLDGGERRSWTYAEYARLADRCAAGLAGLGVRPGDAVAVQLPNWPEFAALIFAINRLGAVYTGLTPSFRSREVGFVVERTRARVLVIPDVHRGFDHRELVRGLRPRLPELEHVVVVGDPGPPEPGWLDFENMLREDAPPRPALDAGGLAHVGFTSGTTGEPKGVMNTHETLDAVLVNFLRHQGGLIDDSTVNLVVSPIGHHTGFLWGVLASAHLKGTAVLLDGWQVDRGLEAMSEERVTELWGAATFLQDILHSPRLGAHDLSALRMICIPGAPIPRALVPSARERLGCFVCPAWGMTEYGIGVAGNLALDRARVEATDGVPIEGCEVRVVDEDGRPSRPGREGDLQMRGAGLFAGYYRRPEVTAASFTEDGWFATGDRATLDAGGFVSLTGRTKDIVIRGGENIPVVEVENLLIMHPAVRDVAVVGMPDARLGERACAYVVLREGGRLSLDELVAFLLERGLSKHYLPERLELTAELPRTLSGKVQKFLLREDVARRLGSQTGPPARGAGTLS